MIERVKSALQGWVVRNLGLSDVDRWARALSGATVREVTVDRALQLATVWACIRLISETVATLPLVVYQRGKSNSREVARDHALYALLHDSPNADHTAVEFLEGVVHGICVRGNAYAEKKKIGDRLVALELLHPDLVRVERKRTGQLVYRYNDPLGSAGSTLREISEDDIFHVRGFGAGGDIGLSPIAYARRTIGAAVAAEDLAEETLRSGDRPTGFITSPTVLTPQQRQQLNENVFSKYRQAETGGLFLLEGGFDFKPVTMSPHDAQFMQMRQWHVEEICRWFRVPPFLIGHMQKSTAWGTGLEQQNIGFLTYALSPYLKRIEQAARRSLIAPLERDKIFVEFNVDALLRADSAARWSTYGTAVDKGIMTRNEVRAKENLPPMPGGDVLTVQSQNVPIDQQAALPPPPLALPAPDELDEA